MSSNLFLTPSMRAMRGTANRLLLISLYGVLILFSTLSHAKKHDQFSFDLNNIILPTTTDSVLPNQTPIPEILLSEPVNGTGDITFSISFTRKGNKDKTIDLSVSTTTVVLVNGTSYTATASFDKDYINALTTHTNGIGTLPPFTVTIVDDSIFEPNESFFIVLTGTSSGGGATTVKVTILDNDVAPDINPGLFEFEVLPSETINVKEGNVEADAVQVAVAVSYSGATSFTDKVSIQYVTRPITTGFEQYISATMSDTIGTGSKIFDFTAQSGSLVFDPNDVDIAKRTRQIIMVPIISDTLFETDEPFQILLASPSNVTDPVAGDVPLLGNNNIAKVLIQNDDLTPPATGYLEFEPGNGSAMDGTLGGYVIFEGGAIDAGINEVPIHVTRVGGSSGEISVPWVITPHTATASVYINGELSILGDYEDQKGNITFADGETGTKEFIITINDDSHFENTEHFYVNLTNGGGAIGQVNNVVVYINENDTLPNGGTVQFSTKAFEGKEGTEIIIELTRTITDGSIDEGIEMTLLAVDQSAENGVDYSFTNKVIMPVGALSSVYRIITNRVMPYKGNKTFMIHILSVKSLLANSKVQVQVSSPDVAEIKINELDMPPLPGVFQFSELKVSVSEGQAFVGLNVKRGLLDLTPRGSVAVQYRILSENSGSGFATIADNDFSLEKDSLRTTGKLEFFGDLAIASIPIYLNIDGIDEGDEKFIIELFAPESLEVNTINSEPVIGIESKMTVTINANGSVTKKAGNGAGCSLSNHSVKIDPLLPLLLLLSIFVIVSSGIKRRVLQSANK